MDWTLRHGKRDLRTGEPVWYGYKRPRVASEPLTGDLATEVLVVGAGISGAMIAEELSKAGLAVAMVDRRGVMKGSTPASTALVQHELDVPLTLLAEKIGQERAARAWRRCRLAVDALAGKIQGHGIACDFRPTESLYLAGRTLNGAGLERESAARRNAGLYSDYLTAAKLKAYYDFSNAGGALRCFGSFSVNPVQMTAGFLKLAEGRGMKIYHDVTVTAVTRQQKHLRIATAEGPVIKARYLVFACGYELPAQVTNRRHHVHSTYAFATKPQKAGKWKELPLIWQADDPYLYLRATADGRIICGGEDDPFSDEAARDAALPGKIAILEKKLARLFPALDSSPDYAWAGAFGTSATGLPAIGPVKNLPGAYAAMAYGGNGITFSRVAAEMILGDITGCRDPDRDLFLF